MASDNNMTIINDIYERMCADRRRGITSNEIISDSGYKRDTVYRSLYRLVQEGSAKKTKKTRLSADGHRNSVYVAI